MEEVRLSKLSILRWRLIFSLKCSHSEVVAVVPTTMAEVALTSSINLRDSSIKPYNLNSNLSHNLSWLSNNSFKTCHKMVSKFTMVTRISKPMLSITSNHSFSR